MNFRTRPPRLAGLMATSLVLLLAACGGDAQRAPREAGRSTDSAGEVSAEAPDTARATAPRRVAFGDVDLTGVGHDLGRADAPIVIVEFSDFGCPFCGSHARQTFPAIDREYIATGKVFYKYVPFVMGTFPNGRQAARSAECAAEQGAAKFWAMHDTLYARQREWKQTLSPKELLGRYATGMRLDAKRFEACYMTHEPFHPRTLAANDRADRLGVRATPSFVVNGRPIEGALPLPQFRELLDGLQRR